MDSLLQIESTIVKRIETCCVFNCVHRMKKDIAKRDQKLESLHLKHQTEL